MKDHRQRGLGVLLLCAICLASPRAGAATAPVIVADFETRTDQKLVRSRKPTAISSDISSRGRSSLRIAPGDYLNIQTPRLGLGRPGDLLKIDLFNSCAVPQQVRFEIFDAASARGYWYRHVRRHVLRPGWNTLSFPLGRLYRGEMSAQHIRDSWIVPAEIRRMDLAFETGAEPGAIYIDNLRFEPDPPMPKADGLFAFDFGPENQAPRHGLITSSRETYDDERGYGWSSDGWPGAVRDYMHPNNILGDFREARGETFSVRVPNGRWHVLVHFEDHGWWSDQFAGFQWRTIEAEGKVVSEERRTRDDAAREFYRFAEVEPDPARDVYETYVRGGRYGPREFDADVEDGRLDIRFDADRPMVCRVSAVVLWPASQAEAAAEWCAELDRRMREQFDAENVYVDTSPRGRLISDIPEEGRAGGLVLFSAGDTHPAGPDHIPAADELLAARTIPCVPGEDTGMSFCLRAVDAGGPAGITAEIPGLEVRLFTVRNRLRRHGGGYTIVPDILVPLEDDAMVRGRTTRQFWLEVAVPGDAEPGRHDGEIRIRFLGQERRLPVSADVMPITLSEPRMAFGLFGLMPDRYAPEDALGEVINLLRRHGLSSVSGVPMGTAGVENGSLVMDFTRADEVMGLLKKAGFALPVDTYGSGIGGLNKAADQLGEPLPRVFGRAMGMLKKHANAAGWLTLSYSMVDEPQWSNDAVAEATVSVSRVAAAAPWLLTNGYWSPDGGSELHQALMNALGRTSLGRVTRPAVEYLKSKGKSIGFYGGRSRNDFGLRQWAAAAEGFDAHYAWHSYIRYGDLYYDLDAREPDVCMLYYTPTEVRQSLRLKAVRAGAYDFLYLRTLADLADKADDGPERDAALELLRRAQEAGDIYGNNPAGEIKDPDAFRREVADAILALTRAER